MLDPQLVRNLRIKRRLTQAELAKIAEIPKSSISTIESNRVTDFNIATVERLARALHVRVDALLTPGPPSDRAKVALQRVRLFRRGDE